MYFKKLPDKVKQGIIYLNQDEVFRERFRHDPVLDELDEEDLSLDECKSHLEQVFSGFITINGRQYKPMTLAVWSWLWANNSPFIRYEKQTTVDDIDFFFYYLQNGAESKGDWHNYCIQNNIKPQDIPDVISTLIKDAFTPLMMMPRTKQSCDRKG